MDNTQLAVMYLGVAFLIPAVAAFGHGAKLWKVDLDDQWILGWVMLVTFWPFFAAVLVFAGVAAVLVGAPCWLALKAGKRVARHRKAQKESE